MQWDDLKIFVTAARSGSFTTAGTRLGIDAATVGRRITRLESDIRSTLFVRSATGLELTPAGAQLLDIGLNAETALSAVEHIGKRDAVSGTVRISAAEGFGTAVMAPALPDLAAARPGLRIELAANPGFLSTSKREVDMAITLSAIDTQRVVVEPLTKYQLALYASRPYLAQRAAPERVAELLNHRIVGYVEDLIYAAELRYLDEVMPGVTPALASSSIRAQQAIIAGGGGIGVLPCFLATDLVRVLPRQVLLERRFWLSTHKDLHDSRRVSAVRTWLRALVKQESERLSPH